MRACQDKNIFNSVAEKSFPQGDERRPIEKVFMVVFSILISPLTHKANGRNTNHLHISSLRKVVWKSAEAEYRRNCGNASLSENPMGIR